MSQIISQPTPQNTRLLFFGTPELAVPSLAALLQAGFQIIGVVTQPDTPVGRQQLLTPPPVKVWAQEHDLTVSQPTKIRTPEFHAWFKKQQPDVCAVVAYGKIFPGSLLTVPRFGFINLHPSLLPELRGATPIQFAILNNLHRTGVTIMKMDEGMDTGPILTQTAIDLPARPTFRWLHDTLKHLGAEALVKALPLYLAGSLSPVPQPTVGTTCKLLERSMGDVRWELGAETIDRMWRAFQIFPGITIIDHQKRLKLVEVDLQNQSLRIKKIQPEGKPIMTGLDFIRGYRNWKFPNWVTWAS